MLQKYLTWRLKSPVQFLIMEMKGWAMFAVVILLTLTGCNETAKQPKEETTPVKATITDPLVYDATIIAELTHVNHGLSGILDQISASDSLGIIKEHQATKKLLDGGIQTLNALPPLNGNTAYRDAALNIMQFHRKAMDNQYQRIVEISAKKKPSSREEEERETLYEQMENVEEGLDNQFFKVRDQFGKQNNIQLPEGGDLKL